MCIQAFVCHKPYQMAIMFFSQTNPFTCTHNKIIVNTQLWQKTLNPWFGQPYSRNKRKLSAIFHSKSQKVFVPQLRAYNTLEIPFRGKYFSRYHSFTLIPTSNNKQTWNMQMSRAISRSSIYRILFTNKGLMGRFLRSKLLSPWFLCYPSCLSSEEKTLLKIAQSIVKVSNIMT